MTCKQLVQGCYAVAWEGVEPTTFELQCRTLSTETQAILKYISIIIPKTIAELSLRRASCGNGQQITQGRRRRCGDEGWGEMTA